MPKFIFAYHGGTGKPASPEDGAAEMQKWQTWLGGMGASCVDMGNPVGLSKTVSADGIANNGGTNPLAGFSFIEANSEDEACQMAKGCPMVIDGTGSVEVAPILDM